MALKELPKMLLKIKNLINEKEKQNRNNPQISSEEFAKMSKGLENLSSDNNMPHIRYVGSGTEVIERHLTKNIATINEQQKIT